MEEAVTGGRGVKVGLGGAGVGAGTALVEEVVTGGGTTGFRVGLGARVGLGPVQTQRFLLKHRNFGNTVWLSVEHLIRSCCYHRDENTLAAESSVAAVKFRNSWRF